MISMPLIHDLYYAKAYILINVVALDLYTWKHNFLTFSLLEFLKFLWVCNLTFEKSLIGTTPVQFKSILFLNFFDAGVRTIDFRSCASI